jgi:hypothetical protein
MVDGVTKIDRVWLTIAGSGNEKREFADIFQIPDQKADAFSNSVSTNLLLVWQTILYASAFGESRAYLCLCKLQKQDFQW